MRSFVNPGGLSWSAKKTKTILMSNATNEYLNNHWRLKEGSLHGKCLMTMTCNFFGIWILMSHSCHTKWHLGISENNIEVKYAVTFIIYDMLWFQNGKKTFIYLFKFEMKKKSFSLPSISLSIFQDEISRTTLVS